MAGTGRNAYTAQCGISRSEHGKREGRESTTALLTEAIGDGLITDRADIARHVSELGEITRRGSSYISVKPHGEVRAIRLKGAIHDAEFDAGWWLAARRTDPAAAGAAGPEPGRPDDHNQLGWQPLDPVPGGHAIWDPPHRRPHP